MIALRVTAHLEAGVALTGWGIAFDGLLAGVLHAHAKAELLARGGTHLPLLEQSTPDDLPLPLARCTIPTDSDDPDGWHWAATCSWAGPAAEETPDVRYWLGRVDHRHIDALAESVPMHLDEQAGRWRAHYMPVLVTPTPSVTWRCVGDLDQVTTLVSDIPAIGKKRAHGQGRVLTWTVEPDPAATAWEAGHLHPDRSLGRPTPAACLAHPDATHLTAHRFPLARTGLRPPVTHPARQRDLHVPLR